MLHDCGSWKYLVVDVGRLRGLGWWKRLLQLLETCCELDESVGEAIGWITGRRWSDCGRGCGGLSRVKFGWLIGREICNVMKSSLEVWVLLCGELWVQCGRVPRAGDDV